MCPLAPIPQLLTGLVDGHSEQGSSQDYLLHLGATDGSSYDGGRNNDGDVQNAVVVVGGDDELVEGDGTGAGIDDGGVAGGVQPSLSRCLSELSPVADAGQPQGPAGENSLPRSSRGDGRAQSSIEGGSPPRSSRGDGRAQSSIEDGSLARSSPGGGWPHWESFWGYAAAATAAATMNQVTRLKPAAKCAGGLHRGRARNAATLHDALLHLDHDLHASGCG